VLFVQSTASSSIHNSGYTYWCHVEIDRYTACGMCILNRLLLLLVRLAVLAALQYYSIVQFVPGPPVATVGLLCWRRCEGCEHQAQVSDEPSEWW
jgi:hypothetical protein